MLRDGPIPRVAHGAIEYVAAVAFIVVPLLLDYRSDAAVAISIVVGVVILVVAATTEGPTSLINQIPVAAHVVLDYLLAVFLIASPFLFGFGDETAPLIFFLALGIAHLLLTIATRFLPEGAEPGRRGRRRRRGARTAGEGESREGIGPAAGEEQPAGSPGRAGAERE
jgi:hypothetical protein